MMSRLTAGLITSAALVAAAPASADTLDVLKHNTLLLEPDTGVSRAMLISPGGQFTHTRSDGVSASGKWWLDDTGRFCFQPGGEATMCLPKFPADQGVGDSWAMDGPTGRLVYRASIVEGRITIGPDTEPVSDSPPEDSDATEDHTGH